jgi:hypothetical protein
VAERPRTLALVLQAYPVKFCQTQRKFRHESLAAPMNPTLVIANKTYSSWSFRPWILTRHFGIEFDEVVIPMAQENTRAEMLRSSPAGKCPSLHDGKIRVGFARHNRICRRTPSKYANLAEAACGAGAGPFARRRNAFWLHGPAWAAADEYAPEGQTTRTDPRGKRRCRPPRTGFWASPQGVRSSWRL